MNATLSRAMAKQEAGASELPSGLRQGWHILGKESQDQSISIWNRNRPEHIHAPKKRKNTAEQWNYVHGQKRGTFEASSQASTLLVLMEIGVCPG